MNSLPTGLVFVIVSTALAVGGMLLVRRRFGVASLVGNHEVAGNLLSIIGTLYAVLLGFVIVDAMERQQELRVIVEQEANGVANIFLLAHGLPPSMRAPIQQDCSSYTEAIINEEWVAMDRGTYSPRALQSVWGMWRNITELKPTTTPEQTIHDKLLDQISQVADMRRIRIVSAVHGIAPEMWTILILGGSFTVIFTYFFAVQNLKVQLLMTSMVSLTLALNVLLLFLYGSPFSGALALRPDAWKLNVQMFQIYRQGKVPQQQLPLTKILR